MAKRRVTPWRVSYKPGIDIFSLRLSDPKERPVHGRTLEENPDVIMFYDMKTDEFAGFEIFEFSKQKDLDKWLVLPVHAKAPRLTKSQNSPPRHVNKEALSRFLARREKGKPAAIATPVAVGSEIERQSSNVWR